MNPQLQKNTRSSLWLIPLFCCFIGINNPGIARSGTESSHQVANEEILPLKPGVNIENQPGLVGYVPGSAYLLEFFMKSLANILDDPTLGRLNLEGAGATLKENADLLILGYPLFGLDPSLSSSEVQMGLDDAYIILEILKNEPELVDLDADTQIELNATAEAIIEELEDGE